MSGATTATGVTMVVEERKSSAAAAGVEADGQNQNGKWKWKKMRRGRQQDFPPIFLSFSIGLEKLIAPLNCNI